MTDYNSWNIENFVDDRSFSNYILNDNVNDVEKWNIILEQYPQIKPLSDKAKQIVELFARAQKPQNKDIQSRLKHLLIRLSLIENSERQFIGIPVQSVKRVLSYAAAIILFVTLGINVILYTNNLSRNYGKLFTTIVGKGQKSIVVLPDGSKVWLNSESELTYPVDFNKGNRVVSLVGEGYFCVAHDSRHPFLVNISDIKVKVYGTEFNIKCYKNEDVVEATLVKGSLSIQQQGGNEIFLKPSQKFICHKEIEGVENNAGNDNTTKPDEQLNNPVTNNKLISNVDTYPVTAWKEQKLVFEDETFADLAVKLERWYDVKVIIESEKIKQYRYRGSFENETIEQAIKALTLATPFNYKFDKRVIYIREIEN